MSHVPPTAPMVSVVLPTHNRSRHLRRALASILAQSFRDLEVIVVDDGSTENVGDIVAAVSDPRIVFIRREQRGGAAAARNTGAARARGRFLAFLDSDDEWFTDKLDLQVRRLEDCPRDVALVVCEAVRWDGRHLHSLPGDGWNGDPASFATSILRRNVALTSCWCLRREAFTRVGPFDEGLPSLEDWDWLVRFSAAFTAVLERGPLALIHESTDSLSLDHARYAQSLELMLAKHAEALSHRPWALANLHYVLGKKYCLQDAIAEGRGHFREALRANPRDWRAAVALALSFGGRPLFAAALRATQSLRQRA